MAKSFYGDVVFKMHFDLQILGDVPDVGRDFDAAAFAEGLARIGVEAVSIFARNTWGWCFYPTKIGLLHPHCSRDLFGEGIAALKKRGIRCLAYYAADQLPAPLAEAHPEWRARGKDGAPIEQDNRRPVCYCGPFFEDHLLAQLMEIARAYPVDGFFLDGFGGHFCYCARCRSKFGRDLPDRDDHPNAPAYRRWTAEQDALHLARLTDAVRAVRPEAVLVSNGFGDPIFGLPPSPDALALCAEATPRRNYPLAASFKLAGWCWRGIPCDIMTQRMLNTWDDWTSRPVAALKMDLATNLSHCAPLYVGDLADSRTFMPFPGHLEMIGEAFDFARPRAALLKGARPLADVALLLVGDAGKPPRTPTWLDDETARGAHLALTDGGWPAHILFEEDLAAHMGDYKTLLIPDQTGLGSEAATRVRDFVRAGGGLVVTGDTALPPDLTGIKPAPSPGWKVGFLDPRKVSLDGFPPPWEARASLLPILSPPSAAAEAGCEVLARLLMPGETTNSGESVIPREETEFPALTRHRCGKGVALWCALNLAADYWRRGNTHAKHLLNALVLHATPAPTVRVEAPADLDVALAGRERELLVHLIPYTPTRRMAFPLFSERVPPIHDITVRLRCPSRPTQVRLEPGGAALRFDWSAPIATIRVPCIEIHGCVVAQF